MSASSESLPSWTARIIATPVTVLEIEATFMIALGVNGRVRATSAKPYAAIMGVGAAVIVNRQVVWMKPECCEQSPVLECMRFALNYGRARAKVSLGAQRIDGPADGTVAESPPEHERHQTPEYEHDAPLQRRGQRDGVEYGGACDHPALNPLHQ